jgi:hypothetical protein
VFQRQAREVKGRKEAKKYPVYKSPAGGTLPRFYIGLSSILPSGNLPGQPIPNQEHSASGRKDFGPAWLIVAISHPQHNALHILFVATLSVKGYG